MCSEYFLQCFVGVQLLCRNRVTARENVPKKKPKVGGIACKNRYYRRCFVLNFLLLSFCFLCVFSPDFPVFFLCKTRTLRKRSCFFCPLLKFPILAMFDLFPFFPVFFQEKSKMLKF